MDSPSSTTKALARRRSDSDLMPPPPPVKKIKRPRQVLDEDEYTGSLSRIIARDFFPGLLESQVQNEYLDAVESRNTNWINNAGLRLQKVMTPGRRRRPSLLSQTLDGGRTPTSYVGDTPSSISTTPTQVQQPPALEANMSLSTFQATYTSEDNESFYKLMDKQNQKRAEKFAWMWNGNQLPSKQMIKQRQVMDRLRKTRSLIDDGFKRDRLAIQDVDQRPARPDAWKAAPRNDLMFEPNGLEEGVVTMAQKAEDASRMGPRSIVYENTGAPQPHEPPRPPSPTASSVQDAIAGRPRRRDQDSEAFGGDETPRVNGYAFVDDDDDDDGESEMGDPRPTIDLGPGDAHNPFKLQQQRKRETLHERMIERIHKSNKESSRNGIMANAEKLRVPNFPSSPRVTGALTPAGQRLWSKMGTPKRRASSVSSFGRVTPKKPRGSLLRSSDRLGRGQERSNATTGSQEQ